MTDLLCVPLKRTLNIDFKKNLSQVIDATSYQTSSFFEHDLNRISVARERICDSRVSNSKLHDLKQYWIYLGDLQTKFPDYQIEFTWFQTLSPKSYGSSQYSLLFEKLNVLYNIASMYSLLALDSNNGSTSSLKTLCLYFQNSAGCFQYILDHLKATKEPVIDRNTCLALFNMMLAQAQECFWLKAVQDSHKHSLIARLAQQVVEYYDEAWEYSRKSELIMSSWVTHFDAKLHYFKAVVDYRNGLALGEKKQYGAMVKSLSRAVLWLGKTNLSSESSFVKTVSEALKNSQRDNDFIYLQPIPSELEAIKPAPMVKALPISEFLRIASDAGECLFADLLPISVMESCSAYNERQEQYVRQHITEPLLALNRLLKDGIPKYEVPQRVRPISEEEMTHYEFIISDQKSIHKKVNDVLSEIESILREEEETQVELSKRYGESKWNLQSSSALNKPYYVKLHKLKDYQKQGETVDSETAALFHSIDKDIVSSPIKIPQSNDPTVQKALSSMENRKDRIQEVEAKSLEHRILPKIVSEYKRTGESSFESLFRKHLEFLDEDIRYVQDQKAMNKEILMDLQNKSGEPTVKRLEPYKLYIEELDYSLKLLDEVKSNIESGNKFYQDLLKSSKELLSEVQEFEENRREHKRELEETLNSEA